MGLSLIMYVTWLKASLLNVHTKKELSGSEENHFLSPSNVSSTDTISPMSLFKHHLFRCLMFDPVTAITMLLTQSSQDQTLILQMSKLRYRIHQVHESPVW